MSYAYTPGLKVKENVIVRKTRTLPVDGEVLVEEGDLVKSSTIIARTLVSGDPHIVPVAMRLGVDEQDLKYYMLKKQGDPVHEGEIIAAHSSFFGLFKSYCKSPVNGQIEFVSISTGQVSIREAPKPIEITAYIPGKVTKVITKRGADIEIPAAFVQGVLGVGGERHGRLMMIGSPEDPLRTESITSECSGKILIGGACVDYETLLEAAKAGASGLVVGGIHMKDLARFVGREMGVAITGQEDTPFTLIITEGFGVMNMADRTFQLCKSLDGYDACINGATQIRAGVIRPELIVPLDRERTKVPDVKQEDVTLGIVKGTCVRIIRDPWFGSIGRVVNLPTNYFAIETESDVRVLEVELADGSRVTVPRANVEIIEE